MCLLRCACYAAHHDRIHLNSVCRFGCASQNVRTLEAHLAWWRRQAAGSGARWAALRASIMRHPSVLYLPEAPLRCFAACQVLFFNI